MDPLETVNWAKKKEFCWSGLRLFIHVIVCKFSENSEFLLV